MTRVLITGGAGYVGSILTGDLLSSGYQVKVIDNLMYGGVSLLPYFSNSQFSFVNGDVRDEALMRKLVADSDIVVHLAAIVGFPACNRLPDMAEEVNFEASRKLANMISENQILVFSSTGSNYGAVIGDLCTEETPLNPLSLYAKTKVRAEQCFMEKKNAIVYRFATAFGVSPRMRLDLLINDFVHQAAVNKYLIIFEKSYRRTFIHVRDMSRAFIFALNNSGKMGGKVFNVGDERNNASKEEVATKIQQKLSYYLHFADVSHDEDQRNYEVDYSKIKSLGFKCDWSIEDGIDELLKAIPVFRTKGPYSNA